MIQIHYNLPWLYKTQCEINGEVPLSDRTAFRVFEKVICAKPNRTLRGLDNIPEDGLTAFKTLDSVIES